MGRMIIGGITVVVVTYVLLAYAQNVATESKTFGASYGVLAKAFRGE